MTFDENLVLEAVRKNPDVDPDAIPQLTGLKANQVYQALVKLKAANLIDWLHGVPRRVTPV